MDQEFITKHRDFYLPHEINLVVLRLVQLRDTKKAGIKSVKSEGRELNSFSNSKSLDIRSLSRVEASRLCQKIGYVPASRGDKCDVIINGQRTGIRCLTFTDRALVNHSTRPKYEKVCQYIGLKIDELDEAVEKYSNYSGTPDPTIN